MSPNHIPNNEGKACDAVVKVLEKRTGETRTDIRHPGITGVGPPVDLRLNLGDLEYILEQKRIEPFKNQIRTTLVSREISFYLQEHVSGHLPKPMYYILDLPVEVSLPDKEVMGKEDCLKRYSDIALSHCNILYIRMVFLPI